MAPVWFEYEILTQNLNQTSLISTDTSIDSRSEIWGDISLNDFTPVSEASEPEFKKDDDVKITIICSHKMNAFMETHACLVEQGYHVEWFETGDKAELPDSGFAPNIPNVCQFGKIYDFIYQELLTKTKNVSQPEKLQQNKDFTLVITCEEGVYHQIMHYKGIFVHHGVRKALNGTVNVIKIGIQSNSEETIVGALFISELVNARETCLNLGSSKKGVPIDKIRTQAGWTQSSEVFARFYNRPLAEENNFAKTVFQI